MPTQFAAAVNLLKEQRKNITTYWSAVQAQVDAFTKGDMVVGTTWQAQVNTLTAAKVPVKAILPKEGSTGWSDTLDDRVEGQASELHVHVDGVHHLAGAERHGDRVLRRSTGQPAGLRRGRDQQSPGHCDTFHATDEEYWKKVYLWNTPSKECIDGRGPICTDFSEWTKAWTEVKG